MPVKSVKNYVRGNYFFYAFAIGSLYPFIAPYFKETLSVTNFQLGLMLLVRPATCLISQPFWSYFIDCHGHRSRWAMILSLLSAGFAPLILLGNSLLSIIVLYMLWSFFNAPLNTLTDAVAFDYLGQHRRMRLAFLRIFASMGWISAVISVGKIYDLFSLSLAFVIFSAGVLFSAVFVSRIPGGRTADTKRSRIQVRDLLALRNVLFFLIAVLIFETANNMAYQFLSVYGKALDANNVQVGWIWAIATISETVTMLIFLKVARRIGIKRILAIGMLMTILRWIPMAFVHTWWQLMPFQTLHAFTFTFGYIGAAMFMDMETPSEMRFSAQAFYSLFVLNTGSIIGSFLGGFIGEQWGYAAIFAVAGILVIAASSVLIGFVHEPGK